MEADQAEWYNQLDFLTIILFTLIINIVVVM